MRERLRRFSTWWLLLAAFGFIVRLPLIDAGFHMDDFAPARNGGGGVARGALAAQPLRLRPRRSAGHPPPDVRGRAPVVDEPGSPTLGVPPSVERIDLLRHHRVRPGPEDPPLPLAAVVARDVRRGGLAAAAHSPATHSGARPRVPRRRRVPHLPDRLAREPQRDDLRRVRVLRGLGPPALARRRLVARSSAVRRRARDRPRRRGVRPVRAGLDRRRRASAPQRFVARTRQGDRPRARRHPRVHRDPPRARLRRRWLRGVRRPASAAGHVRRGCSAARADAARRHLRRRAEQQAPPVDAGGRGGAVDRRARHRPGRVGAAARRAGALPLGCSRPPASRSFPWRRHSSRRG